MRAMGPRVVLKSAREIELMRAAGQLVCSVLDRLEPMVAPGVTTAELDRAAHQWIQEADATPLFLGVEHPQARFPFPASICASVNEEVVHGIPSSRKLREGDIVSVDVGVRLKGYCGDSARTFAVGRVDAEARRLLEVTQQALEMAIRGVRPHVHWSTVAREIQALVEEAGFGVVREFGGHGIGRQMHEEPHVPNYVDPGNSRGDFQMLPGMTLAIEPMVTAGRPEVAFGSDKDRWAMVTRDRSLAAHFEHTVAVTGEGAMVLSNGVADGVRS